MKYFLILLAFVSTVVLAQRPDSVVYSAHLSSTGSFSKTNDLSSFVFNNVVKLGASRGISSFQTSLGWIYGEQSNVKINNDYNAVFDAEWLKNVKKLYFWGIGTYDKSYSLKINYRYQVGAGPGYNVIKNDKTSLIVTDGIMFEQGDVTDAELGQIRYSAWRNSFRVKYRWHVTNIITWDGTGFVQPSLKDWRGDNIIRFATTLSIKVKKWLSLSSSLTYNKITRTERENLVVTYGIGINYN